MKPALRIGISLLLTLFFIYLFGRRFDVRAAGRSLQAASPGLILLSVVLTVLAYLIRAWRWRVLMTPVKRDVGMYNLASTMFIGFMISFIVPFRLGEVARPVLLARREKVSTTATLATVALERLFDIMTVMALLAVFVLTARGSAVMSARGGNEQQASAYLHKAVILTAALVAVVLPVVIFLVLFPNLVLKTLKRFHGGRRGAAAARLASILEKLTAGLGIIRHKTLLVQAVALSFLMWLVIDGSVYLGVRAFDLDLRFTDMFLLIVPLGLGIVMPTPGGVGPYEFLCQVSLTGFWGVPEASAGAAAITLHAVTLLPTILLGLFFMWHGGVRPAEVRKMAGIQEASP